MGEKAREPLPERPLGRAVTYCLIPAELAPKLHDLLRKHFRDEPNVEVIVEQRGRERRSGADRRQTEGEGPGGDEQRFIHAAAGRRVGERRAALAPAEALPLPRRARTHAARVSFVERREPAGELVEDRDTARLVARFQAGDADAFSTLYARYFDRVYSYLRTVLRDRHEAEDAAQDVFMRMFEALPRYERRRQPFRAWMFAAVRNAAIDRLRRSGRLEPMAPEELQRHAEAEGAAEGPEEELESLGWITDRDLVVFVERLSIPQRQVLVLRYMLGLTTAEAARVLGRTNSDVRVLQSRALRFLRDRLEAIGRGPKEGERESESRDRSGSQRRFKQAPVLRLRRFSLGPPPPPGGRWD